MTQVLLYSALLAYIPPLLYAVAVRYSEKYKREPWGAILSAFLFGATIAFLLLTLIRGYIQMYLDHYHPDLVNDPGKSRLLHDIILVPLMMLVLPLGLVTVRHEMEEAEDGIIYGACVGLGFAATENFIFGFFSISTFGMNYFVNLVILRDLSVMLLYAAATSFVGYGITRATAKVHRKGSLLGFPAFYFLGVGLLWLFVFLLDGGPRIYFGFEGFDLTASYRLAAVVSCFVGMASAALMYFTIWRVDRIDDLWEVPEHKRVRKVEYPVAPGPGAGHPEYPPASGHLHRQPTRGYRGEPGPGPARAHPGEPHRGYEPGGRPHHHGGRPSEVHDAEVVPAGGGQTPGRRHSPEPPGPEPEMEEFDDEDDDSWINEDYGEDEEEMEGEGEEEEPKKKGGKKLEEIPLEDEDDEDVFDFGDEGEGDGGDEDDEDVDFGLDDDENGEVDFDLDAGDEDDEDIDEW